MSPGGGKTIPNPLYVSIVVVTRKKISNKKAIECVKASGCVFEGVLRDFYKKDDIFIDAWMYSLLSSEYYSESTEEFKSEKEISIQEILNLISVNFKKLMKMY